MLDAYIIDRIRREREVEHENGSFVPLRIETPREPGPHDEDEKPEPSQERGSIVIDFNLSC